MIFKHFLETLHSEHNEGSFKNSHAEPKPQDDRKKESGRSMVEMLGVLAIVGVLSVVGVIGLSSALDSAKANKLIQALSRRATVLAADKSFGTGFTDNASFGQDSDYTITCTDVPNSPLFFCTVSTVPQNVCQKILKMNWELPLRMSPQTCNQTNDMVYVFGEGEAQEKTTACTTDAECTPQATCTEGVCVEPPLKSCDTNVENPCGDECQICNPTTLLCENACVRKSYLESTGTQYIDTGYIPTSNTSFDLYGINMDYHAGTTRFGSRLDQKQENYCFTVINGDLFRFSYGTSQTTAGLQYIFNTQKLAKQVSYDSSTKICTITFNDDTAESSTAFTSTPLTSNTKSLYMFAFNDNDTPVLGTSKQTELKIYEGTELVRDYIPVIDNDDVPCLYDKVEKKLYHNQGSGNFETD